MSVKHRKGVDAPARHCARIELPGRLPIHSALGLNGPPGRVPTARAELVSGIFSSKARHTDVSWTIAYPPALSPGTPMPVLVALHGRYDDHTSLFG